MEKNNIKYTTKFKSTQETEGYLKYLGAKEVKITPIDQIETITFYILDEILLKYDKKSDSLFIMDGLTKKIKEELQKEPFNNYFAKDHILNLEGLVYLHTIIKEKKDKVTKHYNKTLNDARISMLYHEMELSHIYHDRNFTPSIETNEDLKPLRYNLNKLCQLAYFISIPNIENEFENFIQDNIFHTGSHDNSIKFSWKDKNGKIICYYKNVPNYQMMVIDYMHDDNRTETISYTCNYVNEKIEYMPPNKKGNIVCLDLANNEIDDMDATDQDYQAFNQLIMSFYNIILSELPYLAKYLNNLDDDNIKSK